MEGGLGGGNELIWELGELGEGGEGEGEGEVIVRMRGEEGS